MCSQNQDNNGCEGRGICEGHCTRETSRGNEKQETSRGNEKQQKDYPGLTGENASLTASCL